MNQRSQHSILRVRHLTFGYGTQRLLHDVSFDIRRGSIFAMMGTSGTGKSTLLRALIGLLRPSAGEIVFGGVNYCALGDTARAKSGVTSACCFKEVHCGVR